MNGWEAANKYVKQVVQICSYGVLHFRVFQHIIQFLEVIYSESGFGTKRGSAVRGSRSVPFCGKSSARPSQTATTTKPPQEIVST